MKKRQTKKLVLTKETIRGLTPSELQFAVGGGISGIICNSIIHSVWETLMGSLEHDCTSGLSGDPTIKLPPFLTTSA